MLWGTTANTGKIKEMVVDVSAHRTHPKPVTGKCVDVETLQDQSTLDETWTTTRTGIKEMGVLEEGLLLYWY